MKLVIDSNQLQADRLYDFLAQSSNNVAVLPDFAAMEAYKGDPLKTIFKSMAILSIFPKQVIILKGSTKVLQLSGRTKGLQRRLIDMKQTREFPNYVRALRQAEAGNSELQAQIRNLGNDANEHLEKMCGETMNFRGAIELLGSRYSKEERAMLRTRETYPPELVDKLVRTVMEMAGMIFQKTGHVRTLPTFAELPNTFVFRVTLACYLLGLRRFANGGIGQLSSEKLRNDFVDMMFVAYGTYFDGLMSSDKNVNYMFGKVSQLLSIFHE